MSSRPSRPSRVSALTRLLLAACIAAVSGHAPAAQTPRPPRPGPRPGAPKLVVILVADQFRADYVTMYSEKWTAGLKELLTKGAVFTEAAYPYFVTKTCAGHTTIGTGLLPSSHGMIDNTWYDTATHEFLNCTEDARARALPFGGGTSDETHSAKWYNAPSFADELRRQARGARVVSASLKARSAIGLAGHGGPNTTIVWKDEDSVTLLTSDALTKQRSAAVDAFVRSHAIATDPIRTWNRIRPESDYVNTDQAPGEPAGRATFPHLFDNPVRLSDTTADILDSWDNTPLADDYFTSLAEDLVDRERLGQRGTTDFLAISYSVLDLVGHDYGPRSHEVQDVLFRLDAALGRLFATLDARVGRDHYVVAFTSDHGVAMLPEQSFPATPREGRGGAAAAQTGRLTSANIANAVEAALDKLFGRGDYVEALSSPYLYFRPGVLERVTSSPSARQVVEAAAKGVRGVASVYWSVDIAATTPTTDPILTALRKSYYAGRSGDVAFTFERNWISTAGTNHGTQHDYDQRVPLVLMGAGIAPGQHATAASPVDIVPTLSELTGVHMPRTDGRVLREALTPGPVPAAGPASH